MPMTAAREDALILACPPGWTPEMLFGMLREAARDALSFRLPAGARDCSRCARYADGTVTRLCPLHAHEDAARYQRLAGHLASLAAATAGSAAPSPAGPAGDTGPGFPVPEAAGPGTPLWEILGISEYGGPADYPGRLRVLARNSLRREGIETVADLDGHSGLDLMDVRNFGTVQLRVLKECLAAAGVALAPDPC